MAITAFIITLAISIIAFYYVYQQNVSVGKAAQDALAFACVQYLNANPEEKSCPAMVYGGALESDFFQGLKITKQRSGLCNENSVCTDIGRVMRNDEYREALITACGDDRQCQGREYFARYEVNRPGESITKFIGIGRRCAFIHNEDVDCEFT